MAYLLPFVLVPAFHEVNFITINVLSAVIYRFASIVVFTNKDVLRHIS